MSFFSKQRAIQLNGLVLFLVLALLVSTPLRVQGLIAVLMLYSVAYLFVNRKDMSVNRLDACVLVLLSLYALSHLPVFFLSGLSFRYLSPGLHMISVIPIYLMLRHAASSLSLGKCRDQLEWGVVLGSLGAAALAIYQTQWLGHPRADGFLFHINFGYLSCSLLFLGMALIGGSSRKLLVSIGIMAGLVATLLSTSRGAIFVIPIILIVLLVLSWNRIGLKRVVVILMGLMLISIVSYALEPLVKQRIDYTINEFSKISQGDFLTSSGGRLQLWVAATEAFKRNPVVGVTYEDRESLNVELAENGVVIDWVTTVSRGHAHSQYFETLATGGGIGILALFGYLIFPGLYQLRVYLQDRNNVFAFSGVIFTSGFALFCITEVALQQEMIATYYAYIQVALLVMMLSYSHRHLDTDRASIS
jgi:O-antigen ligase